MATPTPEQDRMHTLAREVIHGKQQLREARQRAEINRRENPESYLESEKAARNADRFVADRSARLEAEFGVTDAEAVARELVVGKGLSFRDKGHVRATYYEGR